MSAVTSSVHLLAGIAWDPQIRGALIVLAAVVLLPGTIYLLLATNLGARVGFLVAVAGLTMIDMVKAVDPRASITDVRLLAKSGGKSGERTR